MASNLLQGVWKYSGTSRFGDFGRDFTERVEAESGLGLLDWVLNVEPASFPLRDDGRRWEV